MTRPVAAIKSLRFALFYNGRLKQYCAAQMITIFQSSLTEDSVCKLFCWWWIILTTKFEIHVSIIGFYIFSCDQAALQMVFSVRPSVCLSVRPSHLFDYVPIIVSSWNFQELLPVTEVTSMQKVKVKGQGHRGHNPTLPFPDCNSSLNSRMMMKWCI